MHRNRYIYDIGIWRLLHRMRDRGFLGCAALGRRSWQGSVRGRILNAIMNKTKQEA